jgi:hypothetical protein
MVKTESIAALIAENQELGRIVTASIHTSQRRADEEKNKEGKVPFLIDE